MLVIETCENAKFLIFRIVTGASARDFTVRFPVQNTVAQKFLINQIWPKWKIKKCILI